MPRQVVPHVTTVHGYWTVGLLSVFLRFDLLSSWMLGYHVYGINTCIFAAGYAPLFMLPRRVSQFLSQTETIVRVPTISICSQQCQRDPSRRMVHGRLAVSAKHSPYRWLHTLPGLRYPKSFSQSPLLPPPPRPESLAFIPYSDLIDHPL